MPDPEPRVRRAPIPDDAVLVVRGDDLEPDTAKAQARAFRRRFPTWHLWGLSAFYARSDDEIDDLVADQLERFPVLTPHVTIAFDGDLGEWLSRLENLGTDRRPNPYHDADPVWGATMEVERGEAIDLVVDLNTMDETGLPWAFLDDAPVGIVLFRARTSLRVRVPLEPLHLSSTSSTGSCMSSRCEAPTTGSSSLPIASRRRSRARAQQADGPNETRAEGSREKYAHLR